MFQVPKDDAFIANCCLSYRHDFGLLTDEHKKILRLQCLEWIHAINNNLPATSDTSETT